ncbi:hypothetical protein Hanom_Chr16g01511681 [Helianthus anomalus]
MLFFGFCIEYSYHLTWYQSYVLARESVLWEFPLNESDEIYSIVGVIQTLIRVCWKLRRRPVLVFETNQGYLTLAYQFLWF